MAGQRFTGFVRRLVWSPSDTSCKMPGCSAPRYVDPCTQRIHDFCGRSHAKEYQAMLDAQKAAEERQKRLKRQQKNQGKGKNQETGVDQHDCNCWSCGGPGLAYSVTYQPPYGPIRFYNRGEPYYEFTNFHRASILLDGVVWPTTEHYFQAQKFVGTPFMEVIRHFDSPRQAFDLSRNPAVSRWRRKDWEDVKVDVMRKALLAKFTQHEGLRRLLLGTKDKALIEHTPYDNFWGNGGDDTGKNQLGFLLMELREYIRSMWLTSGTAITEQPRPAVAKGGSGGHTLSGGSSTSSTTSMKSASSRVSADGVEGSNGDNGNQHRSRHQSVSGEDSGDFVTPPSSPPDHDPSQLPGRSSPPVPLVPGSSPHASEVPVDNPALPQSSGNNSTLVSPPPGFPPHASGPSEVPEIENLISFDDAVEDERESVMDKVVDDKGPADMIAPIMPTQAFVMFTPNPNNNTSGDGTLTAYTQSENVQISTLEQGTGVQPTATKGGAAGGGAMPDIVSVTAPAEGTSHSATVNSVSQGLSDDTSPTDTRVSERVHPEAIVANTDNMQFFIDSIVFPPLPDGNASLPTTDTVNQETAIPSPHTTSESTDRDATAQDTQEEMDTNNDTHDAQSVTVNQKSDVSDTPTMTADPEMDTSETAAGELETQDESMDTNQHQN